MQESSEQDRFISELKRLDVHDVLKEFVRKRYGVTLQDVYGPSRMRHVVQARHEVMYFIRVRFKWSYPAVGRLFRRDYTTVIAAFGKVQGLIDTGKINVSIFNEMVT